MGSLVGIVVVVIGILASVALHEVGHMVPAKKFGVLVPDYAVGFGPALWKKKIGEHDVCPARNFAGRLREDRRHVRTRAPGHAARGPRR